MLSCTQVTAHSVDALWLHTNGTAIVDEQNQPIFLHGVNVSGMEYGAGQKWRNGHSPDKRYGGYDPPKAEQLNSIATIGFNSVRLPIAWANIEPVPPDIAANGQGFHHYNEAYLQDVDWIIQNLARHNIRVILSMHQFAWSPACQVTRKGKTNHGCGMPVWLPTNKAPDVLIARRQFMQDRNVQEGLVAVWQFVANRYRQYDNVVGADMLNEPGVNPSFVNQTQDPNPYAPTPLDDLYRRIGQAIRKVNPNILLIYEGGGTAPVREPLPFNGVVNSFHLYPRGNSWEPEGLKDSLAHLRKSKELNIPLWVGEFQSLGNKEEANSGISGDWQAQTTQLLKFCKENNIGWAYWAYEKTGRPIAGESGNGPVNNALVQLLQSWF